MGNYLSAHTAPGEATLAGATETEEGSCSSDEAAAAAKLACSPGSSLAVEGSCS